MVRWCIDSISGQLIGFTFCERKELGLTPENIASGRRSTEELATSRPRICTSNFLNDLGGVMKEQIMIDRRFNGPPDSGNGGYSCGLLANLVGSSAEVTLLNPPPLEQPLTVKRADGEIFLYHGEIAIAKAAAAAVDIEVPAPPTMEQAEKSVAPPGMLENHVFPTCFVCGPKRGKCDGLRIFAGRVEGRNYVAAKWIPDASLTDREGTVRDEIIWAALDCPGAWALAGEKTGVIVLGKLAVQIFERMKADDPCIVVGWKIAREGRKLTVGTALFSATGRLYAKAKATWVELKSHPASAVNE
jgi:acyl-coenzyme A thioesterase PaaI-like protein